MNDQKDKSRTKNSPGFFALLASFASKPLKEVTLNATTKTFATFSLSAAVGQMMLDAEDDQEKQKGHALHEAGLHASSVYPSHHLSAGAIKRIGKAVDNLCSPSTPIEQVLSMLLASLVDIRAHVKTDRHAYIDPLIKCIRCALDFYKTDEELHISALKTYWRWAS